MTVIVPSPPIASSKLKSPLLYSAVVVISAQDLLRLEVLATFINPIKTVAYTAPKSASVKFSYGGGIKVSVVKVLWLFASVI